MARRTMALTLATLSACAVEGRPAPGAPDPTATPTRCVDDTAFFEQQVWGETVQPVCMGCHTADGAANTSDLVLVPATRPDHLTVNRAVLADLATLSRDGQSVLVRKPLGLDNHGGGQVLNGEDDVRWQHLAEFVARVAEPVVCDEEAAPADPTAGLALDPPATTFRKAATLYAGRLPSDAEIAALNAGGEAALVRALWDMMAEPTFETVFVERLNDVLLTDRYLRGADAIGIFDEDRFPDVEFYEDVSDGNRTRDAVNDAIAREPLMLAAHILSESRPWTEILTADYTVLDAFSAAAWGVAHPEAPEPGREAAYTPITAQIPTHTQVGILSTPAFLARYPSTATNRNRHRAWFVYKTFLATDILTYADRPIDSSNSAVHNPTLNDPQCTVCHAPMDPVAGAFQNWDDNGRYRPPENGWYPDVAPPGFGTTAMPASDAPRALRWFAERAVADPRFATASVRLVMEMFGRTELIDPRAAQGDADQLAALALQDAFITEVATELSARGWDLKYAIERVLTSRYFRTRGTVDPAPGALVQAGTAHLLTPEELDRKLLATTGLPWASSSTANPFLRDRYNLLYGGIDSFSITQRLEHPNGVMAAVTTRMADKMVCEAVPRDFVLDAAQRRMFPQVELSYTPTTPDGFAVPEAEAAIRANLRWLHLRLLGEDLPVDAPEIDAWYALWVDVWRTGRAMVEAGDADDDLDFECQARTDWWSNAELPSDRQIRKDADFTLRAWMAVVSAMLTDWHFLYE